MSKFWQANWEHHIDMLEDEFEGRLHKTAWVGPIGVRWSVSGLNERLGSFFVIFWVFVAFIAVNRALDGKFAWGFVCSTIDKERTALLFMICGTLAGAAWLLLRISELPGTWETLPPEKVVEDGAPIEARNTQVLPRFWKGKTKLRILKRDDLK